MLVNRLAYLSVSLCVVSTRRYGTSNTPKPEWYRYVIRHYNLWLGWSLSCCQSIMHYCFYAIWKYMHAFISRVPYWYARMNPRETIFDLFPTLSSLHIGLNPHSISFWEERSLKKKKKGKSQVSSTQLYFLFQCKPQQQLVLVGGDYWSCQHKSYLSFTIKN